MDAVLEYIYNIDWTANAANSLWLVDVFLVGALTGSVLQRRRNEKEFRNQISSRLPFCPICKMNRSLGLCKC